jgi:hypothetical protein
MPAGLSRTSWAALSAMQAGSEPSSWTRTGVPLEVALPAATRGDPREGPRGSTEPDTRANSVTAWAALDAGQHLAQHVVGEAFHGGEQEAGHGRNIQRIQDFQGGRTAAKRRPPIGAHAAGGRRQQA